MVRPERVELPTYWFVASRSIQLSYGRTPLVSSETIDRISGFFRLRNWQTSEQSPFSGSLLKTSHSSR